MRFLMAVLAYVLMAVLLGWGILLTVHGNAWLLIAGVLAYSLALTFFGCLPKKSSHGSH